MRGRGVWPLAAILGACVGLAMWFGPVAVLRAAMWGLLVLCLVQSVAKLAASVLPRRTAAGPDPHIWPRFTVLCPVVRETEVVSRLVREIAAIDYPRDRLQVLIVCEPNDVPTLMAAQMAVRPHAHMEVFVCPPSDLRTKPRALNAAMARATGEIVTIYDAEDRPDAGQLRAVARTLAADPGLAAVQAPLRYYNAGRNWLTRQFAVEYAALFYVWNPALARLGLPFPLGGTSNHVRRDVLARIGGWDGWNVTEDADLAFRIAAHGAQNGGRIGYVWPPTGEEATASWTDWSGQRSRWMKGFMQTWLAHTRRPFAGGWRRAATLQLTLGLTLAAGYLHVPALVAIAGMSAAGQPPSAGMMGLAGVAYGSSWIVGWVALARSGQARLWSSVFWVPVYWMLAVVPTWTAWWELSRRPFYWNKTRHGQAMPAESVAVPPVRQAAE